MNPFAARKQGRGAQKSSAGKKFSPEILPCFRKKGAGPSGARSREARDAPTSESVRSRAKNSLPARS